MVLRTDQVIIKQGGGGMRKRKKEREEKGNAFAWLLHIMKHTSMLFFVR